MQSVTVCLRQLLLDAVDCGLWLDCWPYASVPVLTTSGSTGSVCVCKENGALMGRNGQRRVRDQPRNVEVRALRFVRD